MTDNNNNNVVMDGELALPMPTATTTRLPKYAGREGHGSFREMTIGEAKQLSGDTVWFRSIDGSARRAKVTSVKTWKRQPHKVLVGIKYGMYEYAKWEFEGMDYEVTGRLLVEVDGQ